jgi:hypothetical protein
MTDKLDAGSIFPDMTLNLAVGGTESMPTPVPGTYQIVLFYRGHW